MDDLRRQLEALHPESFGWSLCCCRHDRQRAEDVLQQVYLKVLAGKARFAGTGSFKTWLFAVIRLTAQDDARRNWLRHLRLVRFANTAPPAEATAETDESSAALSAALNQLPARQRQTLHLVFYQDLSLTEAAAVMGISLGATRTHYHRGKEALRQSLGLQKTYEEFSNHEARRPAASSLIL